MTASEIIAKKRDGGVLSADEIAWMVGGLLGGAVSDAEMAALLMAVVLRGMDHTEATALTQVMASSGETLDLSSIPGIKVDKHSTGGVGDKTTLVVAPLAAALGVPVAKMAGRALGHTGGTIDKLECIPGFRTDLSPQQFKEQIARIGVAVSAQTDQMAPADKRIYALRDATATVESVPLIAASVMSKKLAAGADAFVLDVKVGEGALVTEAPRAKELAELMVGIGKRAGKRVVALVTAMDQPLGQAVGDALEVQEAVETLRGRGPEDFAEVCAVVTGYMLFVGGRVERAEEGQQVARAALREGVGTEKLRELVLAQGGDPRVVEAPEALLEGIESTPVTLNETGFVVDLDARAIGAAVREWKEAVGERHAQAGVRLRAKCGARVDGDPVATLVGPPGASVARAGAAQAVAQAYRVRSEPRPLQPLLQQVIA